MNRKSILLLLIFAISVFGQNLKDENIMQGIPKGFKLGFKDYNKKTHISLIEFIPKGETVQNWSQMITTNIYHKNIKLSAKEYIQYMNSSWKKSCQNNYTKFLPDGKENGYEYALFMAYCKKNKMTNKEEFTYFKAIKGNDSFYVVQKAFAYSPTKEEVIASMKYLQNVFICDTRLDNCPKVVK
ncbi:hypothetical protein ACMC56_10470 [Campylobacterota bacterium DY0563]